MSLMIVIKVDLFNWRVMCSGLLMGLVGVEVPGGSGECNDGKSEGFHDV